MSKELEIVYRLLQRLSPYIYNTRTHSTEQAAQLVESTKQLSWTSPVPTDEKDKIIAGHGRVITAGIPKTDSVLVTILFSPADK